MRERDESREEQSATSDILRMIARSPTELQPVLDAIAERAARLCDAENAAASSGPWEFLLRRRPLWILSPRRLLWPLFLIAEGLLVERLSTARPSTSTTFAPPKLNFRVPVE